MNVTTNHSPRLPYFELGGKSIQTLVAVSDMIKDSSIGSTLVELVFLRASQINGCSFCIDMHWSALIRSGEDPRKLNTVLTWHESPFFSARERVALRWAEVLTMAPYPGRDANQDTAFNALRPEFDDRGITELTLAVGVINAWNRVAMGMRTPLPLAGQDER